MVKWYVVYRGRVPGVYTRWSEVNEQVDRFPGKNHKSFKSESLARASFLEFERKNNMMKMNNFILLVLLLLLIAFLLYVINV
jgi:viroplasmin and RNaseH domain-containing protein